jgi:hypothetical protein
MLTKMALYASSLNHSFTVHFFTGFFTGGGHSGARYNIYNSYVGPSSVATSTNGDLANHDDEYSGSKQFANNPK